LASSPLFGFGMASGVRLGPGKADRERAARSVRRPQIAGEKSAPATA
jgi:hypothetical protein